MYDYLIIAFGGCGAVFAQRAAAVGKEVLVVEKRALSPRTRRKP